MFQQLQVGHKEKMSEQTAAPPAWHVIRGDQLLEMLRRVQAGEDPEMVYLEEYVNAERDEGEG